MELSQSYNQALSLNTGRVVALVNEHSSSYGRMVNYLDDLKSTYGSRFARINTLENREDTEDLLFSELDVGDILCIAGGDGTVNTAVSALSGKELVDKYVSLYPMGGGNANDLHAMLYGRSKRKAPSDILKSAAILDINGIKCDISQQDSESVSTRYAAIYAGVGATALGCLNLNSSKHRDKWLYKNRGVRFLYEIQLGANTLLESRNYDLKDDGERPRSVIDRSFINGPRMAKYGRIPVLLSEPSIFMMTLDSKSPSGLLPWLHGLIRSNSEGAKLFEDFSFDVVSPTLIHFDAEVQPVQSNTRLTIGRTANPLHMITTQSQAI